MLEKSRLTIKFTLLSALMANTSMSAAATDNSDSSRWQCHAAPDGSWQCGSIEPADGSGTRFIAPQRKPSVPININEPYKIDGEQLDWVPTQALNKEQQKTTANQCSGSYVEPAYVDAKQRALDPSSQPMAASAESSQSDENGVTTLTGNVVLSQGYRQIKSEQAILDRDAGTADFTGRTQFREPGILLIGEDPHVNLNNNELTLNDAEFVAHESHMRGKAKTLHRETSGVIRAKQSSITHCKPGANTWALVGSEVKLDTEAGVGTVKHARLHIKDVPVMYFPYMSFPLGDTRKSGFLVPDIGTSDGFDIATPYYWNIAPNYDATLTPRYIADRGALGEAEFRYLHKNNRGELGGAFLSSDDLFNDKDRWLASFDHYGTLFGKINTEIDYTKIRDHDYFSDLGTDLNTTSQSHLLRLAKAKYNSKHWDVTARAQSFQTIDPLIADAGKPYELLPQLKVEGVYPHHDSGLELGLLTEYSNFDRDNEKLTGLARATGHRTRVEPSISWLYETPYSYIKPKATYRYADYQLNDLDLNKNPTLNDAPEISVPVYSVDSGLFFERDTSWSGNSAIQTFEPRLFYLKVPEEENQLEIPLFDTSVTDFSYNQLFRENRFIGGDRVGDTDQISVGLTSRFIGNDGFEHVRASIGQIFYNDDRNVTLSGAPIRTDETSDSPLAAEFMYALKSGWRLQTDIEWDTDIKRTNQSSVNLRYHGDNDHLFNVGYRRRNEGGPRLEQTDLSLIWPISNRWSIISRWNHDLIRDRLVEAFAGLEYKSCCWAVRVVGRRFINDDDITATNSDGVEEKDTLYIQFQLNGLGRIGNSTESLLEDIPGYQE